MLLVCVLGEIPESDRLTILAGIAGTLKKDGIVSITETIFDPHFQKRRYVIDLMHKAGFTSGKCLGSWFAYTMHFIKAPDVKKIS